MRTNQLNPISYNLQFNVAQLLKEGTGGFRLHKVHAETLGSLSNEATIISPITGEVKLLCVGQNILATGLLTATVEKPCGRCVEPFATSITIDLEEEFYPSVDMATGLSVLASPDADRTNLIDEQHILDLQEVVRQEFLLAAEVRRYCQPDCLGLCPRCGQNRNIEPCDCSTEVIDSRWAGLLELINN